MGNQVILEQKAKAGRPLPKKRRTAKRRGRHPNKALSAAFCRTVGNAGRYADFRLPAPSRTVQTSPAV